MRKANGSIRAKRAVESVWSYSLLVVIAFVFLFPCVWLITSSFSSTGSIYDYVGFFPESFSFSTWIDLFTKKTPSCNYTVWLSNTFYVAILSSVFSTILVILTAYTMSRFRFKSRKLMMKMTLLFGIFPTFMNMTALFVIMTQLHLFNNLNGLVILYSCSAPIGYLTQKGFFDTIPNSIYGCGAYRRSQQLSGVCENDAPAFKSDDCLYGAHVFHLPLERLYSSANATRRKQK